MVPPVDDFKGRGWTFQTRHPIPGIVQGEQFVAGAMDDPDRAGQLAWTIHITQGVGVESVIESKTTTGVQIREPAVAASTPAMKFGCGNLIVDVSVRKPKGRCNQDQPSYRVFVSRSDVVRRS